MSARVILCDRSEAVVDAWRYQFTEISEIDIEIRCGDVFECGADTLIVPGNAFGFLDRGLEMAVCEQWGFELQDVLRDRIRDELYGELLVGEATLVDLPGRAAETSFRRMLYVPIYRTPRAREGTMSAYLAARGAFRLLRGLPDGTVDTAVLPGLATGPAGLHPMVSARQTRYAFEIYAGLRGYGDKNLTQLSRRQQKLESLPKSMTDGGEGPA